MKKFLLIILGLTLCTSVYAFDTGWEQTKKFPMLLFSERTAPGVPGANHSAIYVKSDGLFYSKDDAGTETVLSGGGGSTSSHYNDDIAVTFGNTAAAPDASIEWDTASTPDALLVNATGDITLQSATNIYLNPRAATGQLNIVDETARTSNFLVVQSGSAGTPVATDSIGTAIFTAYTTANTAAFGMLTYSGGLIAKGPKNIYSKISTHASDDANSTISCFAADSDDSAGGLAKLIAYELMESGVGTGIFDYVLKSNNGANIELYEPVNNANPSWVFGASSAEKFSIQTVYDAGAQTLDYVQFQTQAASAVANKGKFAFSVDGATDSLTIADQGLLVPNGTNSLPSFSFSSDSDTGFYLEAGSMRHVIGSSVKMAVSSSGVGSDTFLTWSATSATLKGQDVNDATAVGVILDNSTALTTAGGKLVSVCNATVEKAYIDKNGGFTTQGSIVGKQGTDIASASTIVIPRDGNTFELTGTTAVTLITKTGFQDGFEITLIANENVTITHGTATAGNDITIKLAGAGNFAMTADDTLVLVLSTTTAGGQAWREVSRTAI